MSVRKNKLGPRRVVHPELMLSQAGGFEWIPMYKESSNKYRVTNTGSCMSFIKDSMIDMNNRYGTPGIETDYFWEMVNGGNPHFEHSLKSNACLMWSLLSWEKGGRGIFRLSKELAYALAYTKVPDDIFSWDVEDALPLNGMFLSFDHEPFAIDTEHDGTHHLEGVYLCKDRVKSTSDKVVEEILCMGVCADRGGPIPTPTWTTTLKTGAGGGPRDDLILWSHFVKGSHWNWMERGEHAVLKRSPEANLPVRIAYNFLWFTHNMPHVMRSSVCVPKKMRYHNKRSRLRQMERDAKKGMSREPYTYMTLTPSERKNKSSRSTGTGRKLTKPSTTIGHVHSFWTGPLKVDGTIIPKEEWPKKRKLITKWVRPYTRGPESIEAGVKNVNVRW